MVPSIANVRVSSSGAPVRTEGDYVLYWMVAARRTHFSHALQHAVSVCQRLGKPLLVLEAVRAGGRWPSVRVHRHILEGMADNAARLEAFGVSDVPISLLRKRPSIDDLVAVSLEKI